MIRVYQYGLLQPTTGQDLVWTQLRSAHRYYNRLIEIERERRAAYRAFRSAHGLADLEAEYASAQAEIERARDAVSAQRGRDRSRKTDPALRAVVVAAVAAAREIAALLRVRSAEMARDPVLLVESDRINDEARARVKVARAECGVYWGTYLLVEAAVDAAVKSKTDPAFRRWDGRGRLGVQIQGGMPAGELFGDDTRAQIAPTADHRAGRRAGTRRMLRLRVGSTPDRQPIWAEWPMVFAMTGGTRGEAAA